MDRRGSELSRRAFVVGAGGFGLLAGCGRLPWQPEPAPTRIHRVGWLDGSTATGRAADLTAFRQTLGELGYTEGQNLVLEFRWGDGREPTQSMVAELAELPVDVFVVVSTTVGRLVKDTTHTIPVVSSSGDLVAAGLAESYARPGGRFTGVSDLASELSSKRLELLKDTIPTASVVVMLVDAATRIVGLPELQRDAQLRGVQLNIRQLNSPDELDSAIRMAAQDGAGGLLLRAGPLFTGNRQRIIDLAAEHRLPAIYFRREWVVDGVLTAYMGSQQEIWRRVAAHVDRILKGTKPADIPIEQPMTFDFVVNMKTARELGITFPNEIMLQVTEVIE